MEIIKAIKNNEIDTIRKILENAESYTIYAEWKNQFPLHLACKIGSTELVKLFLEHEITSESINEKSKISPSSRT